MAETTSLDLYIAAYADADAARGDWNAIKQLAHDDLIKVDALLLVSRGYDGKIHVDDDSRETKKGAIWGTVGGAVIGLIFPPAILGGAIVGAGIGAGVGGLKSHGQKKEIREEIEQVLPLNSSGIVAIFEEHWQDDVDAALSQADNVTKDEVDRDGVDEIKAEAEKQAVTS